MASLATLLASLQLEQYQSVFEKEAISSVDDLVNGDFTEQDYADLGLKLGERRKLMRELVSIVRFGFFFYPPFLSPLVKKFYAGSLARPSSFSLWPSLSRF